ncbi:3-deoxy-manno-octulosonate cytidylyltransferase [Labrenzia sp. VG12]|uniref:3-deoxy-manno-octulosonate cytidylyltransferase n=1 Tax=Labrenzia sp. VG12 TaxID=2021862 RepID=UPI000B8C5645|nr:manno-octulosonate cytidylyltransferase [Labrenzia sp. VG12]ASP34527.1 3-deoxy-manno-octulosonate cytidylyltransferase [Labrenzia sp. VG12]
MTAAIVIPARYGSGRLPGKPLLEIRGMSMLERVWRIAKAVEGCSRVVIATEDQRIVDHAASFGAEAVLTPESCRNGTERTYAALAAADIQEEAIINFQGDALLTPPWVLEAMVEEFDSADRFDIVTPAVRLDDNALAAFMEHKKDNPSSGTTVVFDGKKNALYFSKQVIPYLRKKDAASVHRHIGLYGYTRAGLKAYVGLQESLLERTEGLEQLRALENGLVVRVTLVDYRGRTHASVDNKGDIELTEQIIDREGELVGA